MKIGSTLIIGAGGIGSHLAEPLARLLTCHANARPVMRIVDGDVYEHKNAERQMFSYRDLGKNKAEALIARVHDGLPMTDKPVFLGTHERGYVNSDEDAAGLMMRAIKDKGFIHESVQDRFGDNGGALLVCLCVDNDATRRLFYDGIALLPENHRDVVILDCGNDLETATVVASFWKERKSLLASPVECYENLKNPKDRIPGGGCQAQAPSTPQLMVANMAAAFSAMLLVQALLDGKGFTDVIQSNIREFSVGLAGGVYGPAQH
jgi:Dinucleotide-utilizing enzymes involved in molybdopterin and thiamine biosynthesis family 2